MTAVAHGTRAATVLILGLLGRPHAAVTDRILVLRVVIHRVLRRTGVRHFLPPCGECLIRARRAHSRSPWPMKCGQAAWDVPSR